MSVARGPYHSDPWAEAKPGSGLASPYSWTSPPRAPRSAPRREDSSAGPWGSVGIGSHLI